MTRAMACWSILGALISAHPPHAGQRQPPGALRVARDAPAPLVGPKPGFAPGLYETESRNSAFPDQGAKSTSCILSADVDAFRRETIAQYLQSPQFKAACRLSRSRLIPGGFAFAMDCDQAQTVIAYTFRKDFFSSTTQTKIVPRPEYSSTILTLSRRIGDCRGQKPGQRL